MTRRRHELRRRRAIADVVGLVVAILVSAGATALAQAPNGGAGGGTSIDLNVATLVVALGTLGAGLVGWQRLRSERPKIVAEIAKLDEEREKNREERLQAALDAAWEEADRLRQARDRYRAELTDAHERLERLERRERELEDEVANLHRALRMQGA